MAPDTPERFPSAASARCTRQDQTRFGGSAERIFQRARQRASPLAPENLLRTVGRRFKMQGSCAPVRYKLGGRLPRAAFCRRIDELLADDRSRQALEVSERFADGLVSEQDLHSAQEAAIEAAVDFVEGTTTSSCYSGGSFSLPSAQRKAIGLAARTVAEAASLGAPEEALSTAFEAAAIGGTAWAVEALGAPAREWLLRDVFGNPFRPVEFSPDWRTENVLAIARGAYEERAFERLPILADALQDAGCDSEELLTHCRDSVFHVPGCWALDLVLGH